jgi:hypothetical protein
VTISSRPSGGQDGERYTTDLGQAASEISEIPNLARPAVGQANVHC